jgi:hypothetical protein
MENKIFLYYPFFVWYNNRIFSTRIIAIYLIFLFRKDTVIGKKLDEKENFMEENGNFCFLGSI